jgi:hypothetical protein
MTTGIPTTIDGTTYRSRVEARWAVLLGELYPGHVEYEPFDADGYIPDFAIVGDHPLLIEVKAHLSIAELAGHTDRLDQALDGHWDHDVMIVGGTPFLADIHISVAGLMRQTVEGEHMWAPAIWMTCTLCNRPGWHHETGEWACHPCGHHDGDHHIAPTDRRLIAGLWTHARETTRWTPNAR